LEISFIRVNLTLNRDRDDEAESNDELREDNDQKKNLTVPSKISMRRAFAARSRSMIGCDQLGIETMMSILSSGGSDSEKEDIVQIPMPLQKAESSTRMKANVLRKTGETFVQHILSFIDIKKGHSSLFSRRRQFLQLK
jgi:hypothetical protein